MFRSVELLTSDPKHAAAVQAVPRFARATQKFLLILPQIQRTSASARALNTEGITESIEMIRENLANLAVTISCGLVAYADETGNVELAASGHVTRSDIAYGRSLDAAEIADHLLAAALARAGELTESGITQPLLVEFDDLIQDYSDRIGRPRATITERKTIRASLPDLFDAADRHLAQMDRLAEVLKHTFPAFVAEYQNKRRIVHVPGTRITPEAAATDGTPLRSESVSPADATALES